MGIADKIAEAAKAKAAPTTAAGGQTAGILKQLSSQATGKAVAPTATGQSSVLESVAGVQAAEQQAAVQEQVQDAATQAAIQEQEMAVQEEAREAQARLAEEQIDNKRAEFIDNTLRNIKASDKELEDREDQHELEMAALAMQLNDKQYVHEINQIGAKNRLDNMAAIKKEAQRIALGNATEELYKQIEFAKTEGKKSREFKEANMIESLDDAHELVEAKIKDAQQAAMISGIAEIAKTGIEYAADEGYFDEDIDESEILTKQGL